MPSSARSQDTPRACGSISVAEYPAFGPAVPQDRVGRRLGAAPECPSVPEQVPQAGGDDVGAWPLGGLDRDDARCPASGDDVAVGRVELLLLGRCAHGGRVVGDLVDRHQVNEITGLVGIYTSPRHVILYTSNGEVRQEFSIVFTPRPVSGELRPSSESSEPQWVFAAAIPSLQMHPSMRQRIQHYLGKRPEPYLG